MLSPGLGTPTPPPTEGLSRREGSLRRGNISKLNPTERRWADNVLRVLKLPNKGSQARIMAGAVATTETLRQNQSNDYPRATQLRDTVLAAGDPPWKNTRRAMAATAAKVELDLLSIPQNQRQLQPLGPGQGVNQAFWINRVDADNQTRGSFLCKPASTSSTADVDGVPRGGEVIREALAGRAAQSFTRQTGIDLGMPESHVISLDSNFLPPNNRPNGGGKVTCSVQEARENAGSIKSLSDMNRGQLDRDQVAGLALFDTMTLNTDRHAGNILVDGQGGLIPIDHGASLVEPGEGNQRISETMGPPHNALLRIAAAHQPLSPKLLKKLKALNPDSFARDLKRDREDIAAQHPSMDQMVSDAAIESARRAALFTRMAARNKPPLSPAAIQVALATWAEVLLKPSTDDKTFRQGAQALIARYAPNQEVIKQVCLASDGEYDSLCEQVEALGWRTQPRNEPPLGDRIRDPVLMLTLLHGKIQAPQDPGQRETVKYQAMNRPIAPNDAGDVLRQTKIAAVRRLAPLAADTDRRPALDRLNTMLITFGRPRDDQLHDLNVLLETLTSAVVREQTARLNRLIIQYNLPTDGTIRDVTSAMGAIEKRQLLDAARRNGIIERRGANGDFG
jgi:Phosphatidylinositol 3- and 4-kinase